jgi:hypothetical protein
MFATSIIIVLSTSTPSYYPPQKPVMPVELYSTNNHTSHPQTSHRSSPLETSLRSSPSGKPSVPRPKVRYRLEKITRKGDSLDATIWVLNNRWDPSAGAMPYFADSKTIWYVDGIPGPITPFIARLEEFRRYVDWIAIKERPKSYGEVDEVHLLNDGYNSTAASTVYPTHRTTLPNCNPAMIIGQKPVRASDVEYDPFVQPTNNQPTFAQPVFQPFHQPMMQTQPSFADFAPLVPNVPMMRPMMPMIGGFSGGFGGMRCGPGGCR